MLTDFHGFELSDFTPIPVAQLGGVRGASAPGRSIVRQTDVEIFRNNYEMSRSLTHGCVAMLQRLIARVSNFLTSLSFQWRN